MIHLENVTRTYGEKVAVRELTLRESLPGELFALLGPNGAGKTTTIKMIVGLLRPSSGTVRLCGHDVVTDSRLANRHLGYVADEPYLYDKLSGREFLQFVADMYGLDPARGAVQIARQIENFSLHEFIDALTESYSHGMKQRVAFAAALLHEPEVLVVDEPMVGLDPRSVRLVKDLLRAKARSGAAVFMSTHLLAIAEEIADRVGIVDRGQLQFLGTVGQLRDELSLHGTTLEQLYLHFTSTSKTAAETGPCEPAAEEVKQS